MYAEKLTYDFFNECTSLSDAARKLFGRDNYRDGEKVKKLASECGFDWHIWNDRRSAKTVIVKCEKCGREIEIPAWKLINRRHFCSQSCAASMNNKNRAKERKCVWCGEPIKTGKYCSTECKNNKEQHDYIERWKNGEESGTTGDYGVSLRIRRYLFEKYNCRCQVCGWGEENPVTHKVPLQIHHIDGNCLNNKEENLQLLCPNHHSLTETYGNLNKDSKRVFRKQKGNK